MALSPELINWIMAELRYPVLATITPSALPSQSVVWFDLDTEHPDTILMNTRVGRRKDRHLRRDPRASLCFADRYDYVTLEGRVAFDDDVERALADIKALARRYRSDPARFDGQERVTIRLHVERVHRHSDLFRKAEAAALR